MSQDRGYGVRPKRRRKRDYNKALKSAEQQLFSLQHDLEQQEAKLQEQAEKNLILAELIYVQERTTAVYEMHKRWLAAGGPTADDLRQQQQLEADLQVAGTHWCLFALETATWEQLQLALSYDCDQWINYLQRYFRKLVMLSEIARRPTELQEQLLKVRWLGLSGCLTPAWAALLEAMQAEGCLVFLALLHGNLALFDAASRDASTRRQAQANPTYWAYLAQRMRLTRMQKLHFRLALENYQRQARAAAARGMSILQETPSYAFLLACETIAAEQQQQQGDSQLVTQSAAEAAAAEAAAAAAEAAAAAAAGGGASAAASALGGFLRPTPEPSWGPSSSSQFLQQQQQQGTANPHEGPPAANGSQPTTATRPSPASTSTTTSSGSEAATTAAAAATAAVAGAAAAAAAGDEDGVGDVNMAEAPGEQLQRQMALFFRQLVALNLFLTDSMSLEQGLIMNKGAYQFWPMLSSIAEAAIQLPDDEDPPPAPTAAAGGGSGRAANGLQHEQRQQQREGAAELDASNEWQLGADDVIPDSIELVMSQRRHTMAEAYEGLSSALAGLGLM